MGSIRKALPEGKPLEGECAGLDMTAIWKVKSRLVERPQAGGEDYNENRKDKVDAQPFLSIGLQSSPLGIRRGEKNCDQKNDKSQQDFHSVDVSVREDRSLPKEVSIVEPGEQDAADGAVNQNLKPRLQIFLQLDFLFPRSNLPTRG